MVNKINLENISVEELYSLQSCFTDVVCSKATPCSIYVCLYSMSRRYVEILLVDIMKLGSSKCICELILQRRKTS